MAAAPSSADPRQSWWWIRHAPPMESGVEAGLWREGTLLGRSDWRADCRKAVLRAPTLPQSANMIWYSSALSRARDTAQTIAAAWCQARADPPAIRPLEGLNEQNFGRWEGEPYTRLLAADGTDPAGIRPPRGESFEDLRQRIVSTIDTISDEIGDPSSIDIIVVAHAGVIRCALAQALELSSAAALRIEIDYLSLTRIDRRIDSGGSRHWSVAGVNLENPRR